MNLRSAYYNVFGMKVFIALLIFCFCSGSQLYAIVVTVTGTINYQKRVYTRPSTNLDEAIVLTPLVGAKVEASTVTQGVVGTVFTNTLGVYSLTFDYNNSFDLDVYGANASVEVGTNVLNGSVTGIYKNKIATAQTAAATYSLDIKETENSGAYNIYMQLDKGRQWFEGNGKSFTKTINAVWPTNQGTFYDVGLNAIYLLGVTGGNSDPDEFDDDVILHEFGHLAIEAFSKDHSAGGSHSIQSKIDLRLAWSEGAATWVSCAIRGNSTYVDSTGSLSGTKTLANSYDNSVPSSLSKEAGNEVAVTYVLLKAASENSDKTVVDVLSGFRALPSSLSNEHISMDTFHDLWTGNDLSTHYKNREMSFQTDSESSFNSVSPSPITASKSYSNLTFYPSGNSDHFSFTALAGATYSFETSNTKNGALTQLDLYKSDVNGTPVQTNAQKNGALSDSTSKLSFKATDSSIYFLKASRFNSLTSDYGKSNSSYSRTVGRYGTYDLDVNIASPTAVSVLTASDSSATIESALASILASSTGSTLTSAIANLTVVSAGQSRNFNSSQSYISTIGTTAVSQITHTDPDFSASISNIPSNNTFVFATLPLTVDSKVPALSTGKLMVFNLKNGTEDVSSGFSIQLTLSGVVNSAANQKLYVQDSITGTFSDAQAAVVVSGADLIFTLTHFSNYVLVNEAVEAGVSSSSSQTFGSNAASSSGGGGGGCFLK